MKKSIFFLTVLLFSILLVSFKVNYLTRSSTIPLLITNDTLTTDVTKTSTFKNIAIIFLMGKQTLNGIEYVTLSEALEKDYVTLFETGNVNELAITNKSNHFIFIHAGDIVKGGRQDRTIGADIIVAPEIKDLPLASFCVEASRWSQRGGESAQEFSVNEKMLPSRNLKMAAKQDQNQSEVWSSVSLQQDKLNENVSKMKGEDIDVRDSRSSTSLQLTLENKDLDSLCNVYKMHLQTLPDSAIGFAYAINGEIFGGDIYNNNKLFREMWPKLLNSIIVEAIAEFKSDTIEYSLPNNPVAELNKVYAGDTSTRNINASTKQISYETKTMVAHHSFDLAHNGWIHKSYIVKDTSQTCQRYEIDFDRNNRINEDFLQEQQINPMNQEIEPVQQQIQQ